jgi:CheY-like chemotaxis protein
LYVDADKTRLAQALSNLLTNAAKYSEPGRRIWLTAERRGAEAFIAVKDSGIGISPHMLSQIFEMFMQVDRSLEKSEGGLGVGLAIVKRLVEMHGVSVEARSEGAGKGSEFVIRLPLAAAVVPEQPRGGGPPQTQPASCRRILIVDDNIDATASLAKLLKIMGNDVRTAHDGQSGIDAALALQPDVILLDIGMPKLNGYDAARIIRAQPWGKSVTLVALTGWGQADDRRKSKQAGFDIHLVKPVEPEALEKLLAEPSVGSR